MIENVNRSLLIFSRKLLKSAHTSAGNRGGYRTEVRGKPPDPCVRFPVVERATKLSEAETNAENPGQRKLFGVFFWPRHLAQSREGITSRTAVLEVPQERGRAATWADVRAGPGAQLVRHKSDIAETTDGSDEHPREVSGPCASGMG